MAAPNYLSSPLGGGLQELAMGLLSKGDAIEWVVLAMVEIEDEESADQTPLIFCSMASVEMLASALWKYRSHDPQFVTEQLLIMTRKAVYLKRSDVNGAFDPLSYLVRRRAECPMVALAAHDVAAHVVLPRAGEHARPPQHSQGHFHACPGQRDAAPDDLHPGSAHRQGGGADGALCSVLCALCSVLCALCAVLCALSPHTITARVVWRRP
jgi:hypothetical protein